MIAAKVVAIDGAAGSGKSTLARTLAGALGLPYVSTGLMYRALTALAIEAGVSPDDGPALAGMIDRLRFTLGRGDPPELEVEGFDLDASTAPQVESTVSVVAAHPEVRARLRAIQRGIVGSEGAVMEGRDIGTVVFPDARVKLFLVADDDVRASRRATERVTSAPETATALARRDAHDAETVPLEPAADAIVLDTGVSEPATVLSQALEVVRRLAPDLVR